MDYGKAIITDTNTYFRLAKHIHPLLENEIGKSKNHIYVLKKLKQEYNKSDRLKGKFNWFSEEKYKNDRNSNIFPENKSEDSNVEEHRKWVRQVGIEKYLNVSEVDIYLIAMSLTYGNILVTDDREMIELANEFDVKTMKTLGLMKIMLDAKHINEYKIFEIIEYWDITGDLPGNFKDDFKNIYKIKADDFKKKYGK